MRRVLPVVAALAFSVALCAVAAALLVSQTVQRDFIPCSTFRGSRKGYVFKRDGDRVGYFLDVRAP